MAQPYSPSEGTEIAPGVRRVDLGKRDSMIPAYKTVSMRDVVYQPKSKSMNMGMANDMVCHCLEANCGSTKVRVRTSQSRRVTCGVATRVSQRMTRM